MKNVMPVLEVGLTCRWFFYQVPPKFVRTSVNIRLVDRSTHVRGEHDDERLAQEIMDAANNTGIC